MIAYKDLDSFGIKELIDFYKIVNETNTYFSSVSSQSNSEENNSEEKEMANIVFRMMNKIAGQRVKLKEF